MKKIIKKYMDNRNSCLTLVAILFTLKIITYYILIEASIGDIFNLIITGLIFVAIFLGLASSKYKYKKQIFLFLYLGFSILMFADSMYYNYYHQTVSVKQIWQIKNVVEVPDSVAATLIPSSVFLVIDIPFVYYLFKRIVKLGKDNKDSFIRKDSNKINIINIIITMALFVTVINPFNSISLTKINSLEFFSSHINDVYVALTEDIIVEKISAEEVLETVEAFQEEKNHFDEEGVNLKYNGIGQGKNLILVQVEALQNFVIGRDYNDQILTPNLNKLIQNDSLYFDQYYSHIGKGNTADAEFSTLNSLYPVSGREVYSMYEDNVFYGLPWILRELDYETRAFHGYRGEFWNREDAYVGQGFEEYYSMEDLDQTDILGLGISDASIYNQTVDIIKDIRNPFFAFIVTLTNHHPFLLPEDLQKINLLEEHQDTKFGNYLQTVNYTDYAIGEFIKELKEENLYYNSIIVFYGDHHGLNYSMDDNEIMVSEYLDKPYYYDEMLNVPMIIHIPGSGVKETISNTGGFVDFLPTIANIMNLDIPHPYILGQDIVNENDGFIAFTSYLLEGSFIHNDIMLEISREGILEGSLAWNVDTYEEIDPLTLEESYDRAITVKQTSEEILDQDLIKEYIEGLE